MLTASQFDLLTQSILDLYEAYNQSVINDIARRLVKMNFVTPTAAWQMQRLVESGMVYNDALERISELTGMSLAELRKAFTEAGVKTLAFDDRIYKLAGLNPAPISLSPAMQNVLLKGLEKTFGVIRNMTMTTAINAEHQFVDALDLAYMQVSSGAMGYDQAIKSAVKNVASGGLRVIDYASGHHDQLDVAVRRAVLTGVAQTTGEIQHARANEVGQDLVQTSAHIGSRPTHEVWQGKVFSLHGNTPGYPSFTETGYGKIDGLCGINCRHSFYPFFEGISEKAYTEATLDEYADTRVKYNGKEYSVYDANQIQRRIERDIRKTKREAGALAAGGLDNVDESKKIANLQMQMRDFIRQTHLDRQPPREGGRVQAKV